MSAVCHDTIRPSAPALVIAGMHRSGTSLMASIATAAGIRLGTELLGATASNPCGHFEDMEFIRFHEACLHLHGCDVEGYTTRDDLAVPANLRPAAEELIATRRDRGGPWGWKEPRTTLFLDHWRQAVPEATFVLVFRRPWEVVDSLYRRGDRQFIADPASAVHVWHHYNSRVLRFARQHPHAVVLVETTQLTDHVDGVLASISAKLGLSLRLSRSPFQANLLQQDMLSFRHDVIRTAFPQAWELYLELRSLAGSRSPLPPTNEDADAVGRRACGEWQDRAAKDRHIDYLSTELHAVSRAHARLVKRYANRRRLLPESVRNAPQHFGHMVSRCMRLFHPAPSPGAGDIVPRVTGRIGHDRHAA